MRWSWFPPEDHINILSPLRHLSRGPLGTCRPCVLKEMEDMILEEQPGMARGDAHEGRELEALSGGTSAS